MSYICDDNNAFSLRFFPSYVQVVTGGLLASAFILMQNLMLVFKCQLFSALIDSGVLGPVTR